MSDDKIFRFTVKAVINKQKTRVLFAEVDNNFADILFRFSTISLGLVMRALLKHFGGKTPVIGSLNNLYKGLTKLCNNVNSSLCENYYTFDYQYRQYQYFPSGYLRDLSSLSEVQYFSCLRGLCSFLEGDYFGILKIFSKNASFLIGEDLRVVANRKGSILGNLNNVGVAVADMDSAETKYVTLDVNGVMDFLLRLLTSPSPLSDIILGTAVNSDLAKIKPESGIPLQPLKKDATSSGKTMILKLTLQKSTNNLLFAQANQDFVNYLFSVLMIPLGRVDFHLGGNTCLKKIDTLCTNVTGLAAHSVDAVAQTFPLNTFFGDEMFMITDDLIVTRSSLFYSVSLLDELKISLSDVEEVELQIGFDEVLSILKASLTSTRALTDGLIIPRSKKILIPKQEK